MVLLVPVPSQGRVLTSCISWSACSQVYSAAADKTGAVYDVETCERVKQFRSHTSCVHASAHSLLRGCVADTDT